MGIVCVDLPPRSTGAVPRPEPVEQLSQQLLLHVTCGAEVKAYDAACDKLGTFIQQLQDAKNVIDKELKVWKY